MAWFKVDDAFLMSSKVMSIPRSIRSEALGVWLQTAVWSAHEMKDGLVPFHVLMEFGATEQIVAALLESHLWVQAENNAVLIHNWNKYQPTRDELESKREGISAKRSEVGKKGGLRSAEVRREANVKQNEANVKQSASKTEAKRTPEPEPEPEPLTVVNTNNVTVAESGRNDIVDINQLKLKAALRAEEMGLKEIPVIRNHIERVLEVRLTMDHTLDLVAFILATAKGSVKNVDAYLVTVCKRNPEAIRNAWIQLDLVS